MCTREAKVGTHRVGAVASVGKVLAQTPPVRLRVNGHMPNMKRDPDNLRGVATKDVLDGLVKAGIIPDDSPRYIHSFEDVFVLDRDNPRIVIDLETDE